MLRKLLLLFVLLFLPALTHAQGVCPPAGTFLYPALQTQNCWTNLNQFLDGLSTGPILFINLPTPPLLGAGTTIFCSNCLLGSNPCTAGGTGANAQYLNGAWNCNTATNANAGGGNPLLENCTPDQTGNSFYNVLALTQYFYASWQFIFNTTTYINCTVYIPQAQTGATILLDIATSDNTSGHTANFQTCDEVVNSGTINVSSALTCASNQTFTTTTTAYNRVTLTFNVQSTLANGSLLLVKIATSPTGTAPTANLLVYPHFVL